MADDPLLTTLLDLDAALGADPPLIIAGGYGLYLKQLHLKENSQIRTLFAPDAWPAARTTNDIDLVLQAEIVTDSGSMKSLRRVLDQLGCRVVETAKYTQFVRDMKPGAVKIDLLAAPLGARLPPSHGCTAKLPTKWSDLEVGQLIIVSCGTTIWKGPLSV